jgi:sugar phosphate isomerase/epimerase
MKLDRRGFIKTAGVISIGLASFPSGVSGQVAKRKNFISRIGICTNISNSAILASAGFSYLEDGVRSMLIPFESDENFNERLRLINASAVPVEACNSFLPADLKSTGPEAVHDKIIEFSETAFRRAGQVGIKIIVFGSSGSRNIPDGFPKEKAKTQFISLCKRLGPIAKKYGVTVVIEPLNRQECNFINSVEEGAEIVKLTAHRNIRLLADIYHMLREDESPENLKRFGNLLHHIHIAEKEGRTAPGTHGEDFTPFFRALKEGGYKGRLSIEGAWENIEVQATNALRILQEQISVADA